MPKIVDKAVKREEILQAALRVFATKGFHFTKMVDIAAEANVGKGTIYEYFRNKDEMLLAAFDTYMNLADAEAMKELKSDLSPVEKIRQIIIKTIEVYARDAEITRVFFDFWVQGMYNPQQPGIDFKTIYDQYRKLTRRLLNEAIAAGEVRKDIPEDTPSIIVGVVEGIFLQWIVQPKVFSLTRIAPSIVDTLFNGILRKED